MKFATESLDFILGRFPKWIMQVKGQHKITEAKSKQTSLVFLGKFVSWVMYTLRALRQYPTHTRFRHKADKFFIDFWRRIQMS